mmetsp:Transcript_17995/g.58261  ORF Transcript_17995/g.58261 Transcript_17995/m.58261 type:complete len:303 (-) Transcript_17995:126-1034(-)
MVAMAQGSLLASQSHWTLLAFLLLSAVASLVGNQEEPVPLRGSGWHSKDVAELETGANPLVQELPRHNFIMDSSTAGGEGPVKELGHGGMNSPPLPLPPPLDPLGPGEPQGTSQEQLRRPLRGPRRSLTAINGVTNWFADRGTDGDCSTADGGGIFYTPVEACLMSNSELDFYGEVSTAELQNLADVIQAVIDSGTPQQDVLDILATLEVAIESGGPQALELLSACYGGGFASVHVGRWGFRPARARGGATGNSATATGAPRNSTAIATTRDPSTFHFHYQPHKIHQTIPCSLPNTWLSPGR